jgi:hypothetical protein
MARPRGHDELTSSSMNDRSRQGKFPVTKNGSGCTWRISIAYDHYSNVLRRHRFLVYEVDALLAEVLDVKLRWVVAVPVGQLDGHNALGTAISKDSACGCQRGHWATLRCSTNPAALGSLRRAKVSATAASQVSVSAGRPLSMLTQSSSALTSTGNSSRTRNNACGF